MVLDIKRLLPLPLFEARMSTFVQQLRAAELAPGSERIYLPGELEFRRREARLRAGIPLPEEARAVLRAVGENLGLQLDI
jgi:LDH2 family malate/lactate/ureidoglycolate dehydrogenase